MHLGLLMGTWDLRSSLIPREFRSLLGRAFGLKLAGLQESMVFTGELS